MANTQALEKSPIKLSFYGAAGNVTGSSYILEFNQTKILIDCGLYQEREFLERNWNRFPFEAKSLKAVLLTHGHLDHCGLLPKLFREGFKGKVYSTNASLQIAQIILNDSAKIQEEDANAKIKRHQKENRTSKHKPQPLYTPKEVDFVFKHTHEVNYREDVQVSPDMKLQFINTGHILGSAAIKITTTNANKTSVLFSGDIGRYNKPILQDPDNIPQVDYIITESTYGGKEHLKGNICDDLKDIVLKSIAKKGNIIIPSFAVERTQELLYHLFCLLQKKEIPSIPIYLDSPMAAKAIKVFEENTHLYDKEMVALCKKNLSPFRFNELEIISTRDESKKVNGYKGSAIIIAGSGMCTGGRIKHHLAANIQDAKNCIVFVGYQANGTLGRHILEGDKEVRILGNYYQVKASVLKLNGLSAHADRTEIITWLKTMPSPPKKIFITHGEESSSKDLELAINEKLNWETTIPKYDETFTLQ
jgi:metallo-beta-lactamase family protein